MTLALHTIAPASGSTHRKKRIGRGNASGRGTYSTKGLKGQKARKGVSNLKRLGMRQVLLRTPKQRGFKSQHAKAQVITLAQVNKAYQAGETVDTKTLKRHGLIESTTLAVKLLGPGNLVVKDLNFRGIGMSESAKKAVESAGAKIA